MLVAADKVFWVLLINCKIFLASLYVGIIIDRAAFIYWVEWKLLTKINLLEFVNDELR